MNSKKQQWNYLEPRHESWRKQLYIKGQKIKASDIYSEKITNNQSIDEVAENWGLPKYIIEEAIEYCELHQELLKEEAKKEHIRLARNKTIRGKTYKIIRFISIIFLIIFLIVFRNIAQVIIIGLSIILFLRFVYKIPFLGDVWKELFGQKTLWDWLDLLLVPIIVLVIGIYFTNYFTTQQIDVNIEKARYEITQNFLDIFQKENFIENIKREVENAKKNDTNLKEAIDKHPEIVCRNYQFLPNNNLVRSKVLSTLDQLSRLKASKSSKLVEKRHILELLRSSGLLKKGEKGKNYLTIAYANMSSSDLRRADLNNTCLDSVIFTGYDKFSISDMRRIRLEGSILTGANLRRANLRYAFLENTDLRNYASLENADLRGAELSNAKIDNTTVLKGAIYNTVKIKVPQKKEHWEYNLLCKDPWKNYLKIPGYCLDPIDYQDIKATTFPKFCNKDNQCEKMTQEQIKKLGMKEDNTFPSVDF